MKEGGLGARERPLPLESYLRAGTACATNQGVPKEGGSFAAADATTQGVTQDGGAPHHQESIVDVGMNGMMSDGLLEDERGSVWKEVSGQYSRLRFCPIIACSALTSLQEENSS